MGGIVFTHLTVVQVRGQDGGDGLHTPGSGTGERTRWGDGLHTPDSGAGERTRWGDGLHTPDR